MKVNDLKIKKINESNEKGWFNVEKNYDKVKDLISISITVNKIDGAIEFLEECKKEINNSTKNININIPNISNKLSFEQLSEQIVKKIINKIHQ